MKIVTGPLLISQAIFNHLHSNTPKHHKPVDTPVARKDDALYQKVQRSFPCASLAIECKCVFTWATDIKQLLTIVDQNTGCYWIIDIRSSVKHLSPIIAVRISRADKLGVDILPNWQLHFIQDKNAQEKTSCKSFIHRARTEKIQNVAHPISLL